MEPSLFSSWKKPKENEQLKQDLIDCGVTENGAALYAAVFAQQAIDSLTISPRDKEIFPSAEIADKAFKRLLPEMEGCHFKSLHIENIGSMITDKSLFEGKSPVFTADAVSFKWCDIDSWNDKNFMDMLASTQAKSVFLKQTNIGNEHIDLGQFLLDNKITEFAYGGSDISFAKIGEKLKQSELKKLDISFSEARFGGITKVLENLPHTLEELNISNNVLNTTEKTQALYSSLGRMKNLKKFAASGCSFGDYTFQELIPRLPAGVEELNMGSNPYVTDTGAQILLDFMESPNSRVRKLDFEIMLKVSPEIRQKLQLAAEYGQDRYMQNIQQEKAALIAKTKEGLHIKKAVEKAQTPEEIKGLLCAALENGVVDKAFEKLKQSGGSLSLDDAMQTGKDGRTFIQACADMGKTPEMMAPELYGNVKDFQAVFNALPEKEKRIYDGQKGRPSFQKIKNQIMAAAVRNRLAKTFVQR